MESGLSAILFFLVLIVVLFLLFRVVVWWYWGIDKALKNLEIIQNELQGINHKMNLFFEKFGAIDIIQNQLQGINHKIYLFAKKFDVVDNSKEEKIKPKVDGDIVTCPKCQTHNPINFEECRACGFKLK